MDNSAAEHRSRRRSPRRIVATACAAAALLAAGVLVAPTAGAATVHQNFTLAGSLTIAAQPPIEFPAGSGYAADIDSTTGAITNGTLSIPSFSIEPLPGIAVGVTITSAGSGTGTLDPVTGAATVTNAFNVTLDIPALTANCTLGPVNVTASTSNSGGSPFAGDPASGVVTDSGFVVPAVSESGTCSSLAAGAVNSALGLPTELTSITMTLTKTAVPPTPPTPPTPPAPTVPVSPTTTKAAAAPASTVKPTFTG